jgi:hypothetical protein
MVHDNSLQHAKLAQHTDRQVSLHYVVANQREYGHPWVLVALANGVEGHNFNLISLV